MKQLRLDWATVDVLKGIAEGKYKIRAITVDHLERIGLIRWVEDENGIFHMELSEVGKAVIQFDNDVYIVVQSLDFTRERTTK